MRTSVSKNVIKKMVTLPEGRLWRDHAPAKVDQRKVRLYSASSCEFLQMPHASWFVSVSQKLVTERCSSTMGQ